MVASAVGGLLSLVDDGSTGRLIQGRNPSDYGGAMAEILDDSELRTAMSVAARHRASSYTWHAAAAQLRGLYEDLAVTSRVSCESPPVSGVVLEGRVI